MACIHKYIFTYKEYCEILFTPHGETPAFFEKT